MFQLIGILGCALVMAMHFTLVSHKITAKNNWYHVVNILGAVLLLISLYDKPNVGSILIEIMFIGFALYGIFVNKGK